MHFQWFETQPAEAISVENKAIVAAHTLEAVLRNYGYADPCINRNIYTLEGVVRDGLYTPTRLPAQRGAAEFYMLARRDGCYVTGKSYWTDLGEAKAAATDALRGTPGKLYILAPVLVAEAPQPTVTWTEL